MTLLPKIICAISAPTLLFCSESKQLQSTSKNNAAIDSTKGLTDDYQDYFPIGVAFNKRSLVDEDSA